MAKELAKRPLDVRMDGMTLARANELVDKKPAVAAELIIALARQNTEALPGTSFVRRADNTFLKKLRTTVVLTESDGTLVSLGRKKNAAGQWVRAYDLSISGYRKLNELPGIQIIRPETVTVDGQKQMNPYIQVNPETRMPEVVYSRCLAVGYSPTGSLVSTDVMVRLDINIYLLENIQSKMDRAKTDAERDAIGIYGADDEPPDEEGKSIKGYRFMPIHSVGGIGLWVNLRNRAFQDILKDHTTRLKFIERLAQSFAERNALKAHPSMPKGIDADNGIAHVRVTGWTTDFDREDLDELRKRVEDDNLGEFRDGTIDVTAQAVVVDVDEASRESLEAEANAEQANERREKREAGEDDESDQPAEDETELLAMATEAYGRLCALKGRKGAEAVLEGLGIEKLEEAKPEQLNAFRDKIKGIEDEQ